MTGDTKEYDLSVSKTYGKLLKSCKTQREVWELIDEELQGKLMDQNLSWIADIYITLSQEIQDFAGVGMAPTAVVSTPAAARPTAEGLPSSPAVTRQQTQLQAVATSPSTSMTPTLLSNQVSTLRARSTWQTMRAKDTTAITLLMWTSVSL